MTFFEQFFSNTIFLTAAFGWLVAQVLKTLIHLIVSKKFVAERLVGSGGMPSSHSATVCALVTAVCYEYGAGSFEFAISLILAIIVMYDAMGVRRETGIQAQVLNLLQDLQEQRNMTYMFVTHDLSVVRHISDDICVMYLGQLVEVSPAKELFKNPLHPYTKALLSAIPSTDIHHRKERIVLKGEITSPINPKPGCRFAARCPYAKEECHQRQQLTELEPNHFVSCCRCKEINGI